MTDPLSRPGANCASELSTRPSRRSLILWLEACRRGVLQAQEVAVLGDGAHWIWRIVQERFPQATQILDWYHATEYVLELRPGSLR